MIYLKQLEEELTASFFKEKLLNNLHIAGIPEFNINIRIASEKASNKKSNTIGFYRQQSQFISKPYMSLSLINTYRSLLEYGHIDNETPYERVRLEMLENMMDTVCHEYGHVIEEYLNIMYRRETSNDASIEVNKVFKEFKENFVDNEDFAEQFGLWLARRDVFSDEEALFKVVNYYNKEVFSNESLDWVKLPKEQREIMWILDNSSRMSKWDIINNDMVGQSFYTCSDIIKTLKNTEFNENYLIKLSEPKNHSEFKLDEIKFKQYSHNIVEINHNDKKLYLDLLCEHTNSKLFSTLDELEKVWGKIEKQELKISKKKNKTI